MSDKNQNHEADKTGNQSDDAIESRSAKACDSISDEWVSEILDSAVGTGTNASRPAAQAQLQSVDRLRASELLWIHALLEESRSSQIGNCEAKIQRAMVLIKSYKTPTNPPDFPAKKPLSPVVHRVAQSPHPERKLRTAWMTAVIVFLGCGIWFETTNPSRQARAAVEHLRQVAAQNRDREYRLEFTSDTPLTTTQHPSLRRIVGNLYVRGGEAFAFQAPAVIGTGSVWIGGNSAGVWLKPAHGPLTFEGQPGAVLKRWLKRPIDSHFLQIASALERLEMHYKLEMLPSETLRLDGISTKEPLQHLRGICRVPNSSLPNLIEVWAAQNDGNVVRLELIWHADPQSNAVRIEFTYLRQDTLPDDWYRPEGHPRRKNQS